MALDLTALSNIASGITSLNNLILVNPQKATGIQPQPRSLSSDSTAPTDPAFLFHYEGEQTLTLATDITDHYVEDNTAIQDQIAKRPMLITTLGYIGELADIITTDFATVGNGGASGAQSAVALIQNKLTTLQAYVPQMSITALLALNEAFQAYQIAQATAAAAVQAASLVVGNLQNQTRQQKAFTYFKSYYEDRRLFTVQTPWGTFKNMAIQVLRVIQEEGTDKISDFEITFKEMRFADTLNTSPVVQSRLSAQSASLVNNGLSSPVLSPLNLNTVLGGIV